MSNIFITVIIIVALYFIVKSRRSDKELTEFNKQQGQSFLEENAKNVNVETTDSGLQYEVLTKGSGQQQPTAKDKVKVHYHGTLIDGTVFDSSVERDQPISFGLNQVIAGWTEGLQLMVVGDKTKFTIASHLAYGNRAAGKIPPGSVLIFEVELLAINE